MHAVLARDAPGIERVDVTHGIPAHDVRAGALALWRAAPWLTGGVILAVVDPGVGTDRRAVALRVESRDADVAVTHLVGPDNGLLVPAASALGAVSSAVELPVSHPHTFAGRDTFAPAAAALATGVTIDQLGGAIDPAGLAGRPVPEPSIAENRVDAEVLWVDKYGNAQLNIGPRLLPWGGGVEVRSGRQPRLMRVVSSYGAIPPDEFALVVDSYGLLAICADREPAAAALGLSAGDPVVLRPADASGPVPPDRR